MTVRYYGIRHHGPGSAQNLLQALENFAPDCILIEMPADVEAELAWANHPKMVPPVALLVYNPKDFGRASYLPFAEFSPEWQALKYSLKRGIPVKAMDLPISMFIGLPEKDGRIELFERKKGVKKEDVKVQLDPLGFLASLAGYTDSERWWEHTFERYEQAESIFEAIGEMMTALREELQREETKETLLREAFMRKTIRGQVKEGFQRLAVVCGAWHVPAVQAWKTTPVKSDNAVLKGLKKTKTSVTWIPWAYNRLARSEGYGAGVISPAWYEMLFRNQADSHIEWMSRAARLLRSEDLSASAAHAMEASRLASTLAALRGFSNPGLGELEESAKAVFTEGTSFPLSLIKDRLMIGDKLGKVPKDLPKIPLQKDFEKQLKSARLTKESQTSVALTKELDLRKDSNLKASLLLHRLHLLDIPWGQIRQASEEQKGGFKEAWRLKWKAEFTIRLIEAGMWGSTVLEAVSSLVKKKGSEIDNLNELTELLYRVLPAELPEALEYLLDQLEEKAALSQNISDLIDALPPLVQILRFGDIRETNTDSVRNLLEHMIPRIFIGLPAMVSQIDDSFAQQLFQKMASLNHSLGLLRWDLTEEAWLNTLQQLRSNAMVHPLIQGFAVRLSLDKETIKTKDASRTLKLALSDQDTAPFWLEGFLFGSGLLLLHHAELWQVLHDWVRQLDREPFHELLPTLRRTFSRFTPAERQKILAKASGKQMAGDSAAQSFDPDLLQTILPVIRQQL